VPFSIWSLSSAAIWAYGGRFTSLILSLPY
jgi:hypothetical protein